MNAETPETPTPAAGSTPDPVVETTNVPADDAVPNSSDDWQTPEVKDAMNFDPFSIPEEDEIVPAATDENSNPSADGGEVDPAQPASVIPVEGEPEATPQVDPNAAPAITPETQALHDQIAQLTNVVQGMAQPAEPDEQPLDALSTVPEYNFNLPDDLMAMVNSEDPNEQKQGMSHLISGVAKGIHQTVAAGVQAKLAELSASIPDAINQVTSQQAETQRVATDMYTKYPQLDTPEIRPMVLEAWKFVSQTHGNVWNDTVREAVAQRVIASVQGIVPAAPAGTPPAAPANPTPFMGGSNAPAARPIRKPGPKSQQDHMDDMIGDMPIIIS